MAETSYISLVAQSSPDISLWEQRYVSPHCSVFPLSEVFNKVLPYLLNPSLHHNELAVRLQANSRLNNQPVIDSVCKFLSLPLQGNSLSHFAAVWRGKKELMLFKPSNSFAGSYPRCFYKSIQLTIEDKMLDISLTGIFPMVLKTATVKPLLYV